MAIKLAQVILGAGATRVSATSVPARQITIQNNSGAAIRVGDSTVSATSGILLSQGSPGGNAEFGSLVAYNVDLQDFWLFGTAASVIDVLWMT